MTLSPSGDQSLTQSASVVVDIVSTLPSSAAASTLPAGSKGEKSPTATATRPASGDQAGTLLGRTSPWPASPTVRGGRAKPRSSIPMLLHVLADGLDPVCQTRDRTSVSVGNEVDGR